MNEKENTNAADTGPLPGLTRRQDRFARAYAISGNGTQAAKNAGYSENTARNIAAENLAKPDVLAAVSYYEKPLRESARVAAERAGLDVALIVRQTKAIASFDPRRLFDADGKALHIADLDDETAACVGGIEVKNGEVVRYKILDKNVALDRAARILGVYEADNSQQNPITALLAGLGKSSFPVVK